VTAAVAVDTAIPSADRPATSAITQWWVLTVRVITPTLRNGEVFTQIATSIMFTVGYYIPLKKIMGAFVVGMSYGQYLMPLIALQAVALTAAFRSASDSVEGINTRFKAMAIGSLTPLASRMSASMYRCVIALVTALVCGYVIGFRFHGGWLHAAGFCALMVSIGAALSLLGDLIGVANENPEATVPVMLVPQLFFGLLSVGLQPVERFPEWIRPFVRNQPVSQFVDALRALAGDSASSPGSVTWSSVGPALAWITGLIAVSLPLHAIVSARRR
jgi:ABC-2 type transport system permease protein